MVVSEGRLPRGGFAKLVPELLVQSIAASQQYWCEILGFTIAYQRSDQGFVYLERPEGAQIMLCQRSGNWEMGTMEAPFGRGVMFQIYVDTIEPVIQNLNKIGIKPHAGPREVWRRQGEREGGSQEVFVLDPDGYLVMIAAQIGERPLPNADVVS